MLAPGPRDLPLQYVDVRDLAAFLLDSARDGLSGAVNAVGPSGHTTMGEILEACVRATGSGARLCWTPPETVLAAKIAPWTSLPFWLPPGPEHDALHRGDVSWALAAGLRVRPVRDTVDDTWAWLCAGGRVMPRTDRAPVGLGLAVEAAVLDGGGSGAGT